MKTTTARAAFFGPYEVDVRSGEVRRHGIRLKMGEQPFQILLMLLASPGEMVTREELRAKLWADNTFVDFAHGLNSAVQRLRDCLSDTAEKPLWIETVPRRGYRFIGQVELSGGSGLAPLSAGPTRPSKAGAPSSGKQPRAIDSLAVLPLENASGDADTEYLSDGIAETLINTLAQLRRIRVVPWTLTSRHRGTGVDPLAVGHDLGVRAVLSGRMLQRGDDLIVSVELMEVAQQAHLWGGRYNRKMADLVTLQEELATEISEKLRLQLTGDERKRLRKRPTQNNESFRLVLQAQHYINGLSPEGLRKGIVLCEQAIKIDPAYAVAHARLSFAHVMLGILGYIRHAEVYPRMTAAAKKALELDDTLADAHISLGYSFLYQNWDATSAERAARRSLELNPDSPDGFALLDIVLSSKGRLDEAIAAGQRAVELAPFDYYPSFNLAIGYYHAQRFDEAIEQFRKTVDIDPGSPLAHVVLAQSYAAAGKHKNSTEECELALALNPRANLVLLQVAVAYAMLNNAGEAHKLMKEVEKDWKSDGVSAFWLACAHACLDEKEKAFEWLETAYQEHAPFLAYLKIMFPLERLHGDPRFDALVKRIGIPD